MNDIPLSLLFIALAILILISAFFSGSETSLMSINRYRLRNLVNKKNKAAIRVSHMLDKVDSLLSTILLGNNFVNILASSIATIIGIRLWGDTGIAIATGVLTFVILVFAEITPKTIAARQPEKFAFAISWPLQLIIKLLSPLVWVLNIFTSSLLKLLGIHNNNTNPDSLSSEELRTAVAESQAITHDSHAEMLLGILDLENLTVEDIMIPRHEIVGIDISQNSADIRQALLNSSHTRLPVYKGDISQCIGMIHIKDVLKLLPQEQISKKEIMMHVREPLFVPANSLLDDQLKQLQKQKRRTALVVDEYGDLQGLITLEDILEEIVGNFTTNDREPSMEIHPQTDGSFLVDCTILVRELNQELGLNLPTGTNAKTLNGLILHMLEDIPERGTSLKIANTPIEIIATKDNIISTVKIN